jgi:hypothetical protein
MKKQVNIRMSELTLMQIKQLCEYAGDTKTGVVAVAVDRMHTHFIENDPKRKIALASLHDPDCQCSICVHGADEWLQMNHPSEY